MRRLFTVFVAVLVLGSMAAPAMAASSFNAEASAAQNPYISADVTVATHDRETMSPGEYEDNSGEVAELPATVDRSEDVDDLGTGEVNAYSFIATDVDFQDAAAFPHGDDDVSAVDNESEWSVDTSSSAGSMTVSDAETAPGVEALEVSTASQTSGDTAVAAFDNVSVTSDIQKRYLQTFLDVRTLDSGAEVQLRAVDADGDYVQATINSAQTGADESVIGNATGEGYVYQRQVGAMAVAGSGDGTMSEIQSIEVAVLDGDATIRMSALNADKTGEYKLAEKRVDTDDSDDFETETIREVATPGAVATHDLSTMGATFENAVIHGLEMPMDFRASDLDSDDSKVNVSFGAAESYPSFDNLMTAQYRLVLPDAYDLSYANAQLEQEQTLPASRYDSVEYREGAGDTEFENIDAWTDATTQFTSQGDEVVLDSTIQPGQQIAISEDVLVTGDERSQIEQVGGVGQFGVGGGGLVDQVLSIPGAIVATIAGFLGLRARGS